MEKNSLDFFIKKSPAPSALLSQEGDVLLLNTPFHELLRIDRHGTFSFFDFLYSDEEELASKLQDDKDFQLFLTLKSERRPISVHLKASFLSDRKSYLIFAERVWEDDIYITPYVRSLKNTLDHIKEVVFQADNEGKIKFLNPAWVVLTGREVHSSLNTHLTGYFTDNQQKVLSDALTQLGQGIKEDIFLESELQRTDRKAVHIEIYIRRNTGKSGKSSGFSGSIMDVTQRLKATEDLRNQKVRYEEILNSLPLNIFEKDREGLFTFMNRTALNLLNKKKSEVIGKTDFDILPAHTADKFASDDLELRESNKSSLISEEILNHKDGAKHLRAEKKLTDPDNPFESSILGYSVDVTELKEAERKLELNVEFIRRILDTDPNLIFIKNRTGDFLMVNKAVCQLFDKKEEELVQKANEEVHHDRHEVKQYNETDLEVISTGQTIALEETFTLPNGVIKHFYTVKAPIESADGTVNVLGISTDITERKLAEQKKLFRYSKRQEMLLSFLMSFQQHDHFRTSVNRALAKIGEYLEVSRVYIFEDYQEGKKTRNTFEWCAKGIEPQIDNLQNLDYKEDMPSWESLLLADKYMSIEDVRTSPDDIRSLLEVQDIKALIVVPFFEKGIKTGFIGFDDCLQPRKWSENIKEFLLTFSYIFVAAHHRFHSEESLISLNEKLILQNNELQVQEEELASANEELSVQQDSLVLALQSVSESEFLYKTLAKNYPDGFIALLDRNSSVVFAAGQKAPFLPKGNFEDFTDLNFLSLFPEAHHELLKDTFNKADDLSERASAEFEYEDTFFEVSFKALPLSSKGVETGVAYIALTQDLSERKSTEKKLRRLNRELVARNNELEQFSFVTSHNLRSPLSNILGLIQLFDKENSDSQMNSLVIDKIGYAANHLDTIVKDLNDIIAIRKDVKRMKSEVYILKVFQEIFDSIALQIEQIDPELSVDLELDDKVFAVRSYLHNIILNLLTNSLKYRQLKKRLKLSISLTESGSYQILEIKDNGLGIDMEKYGEKLFGLYKRFHLHVEGKGLGLYLVKTQVENMDGRIEVESAPMEGTCFKIYLPKITPETMPNPEETQTAKK